MNSSYIVTKSGVSLFINCKPYSVSKDHPKFGDVMDAVRDGAFDTIPGLINKLIPLEKELEGIDLPNDITIDVEGGIVTCQGTELPSTLSARMVRMVQEGFDVEPMSRFVSNLFNNPSYRTIEELYAFLEYGSIPITPDGCFVAYKKVRDDWMDCHTGTVLNKPADEMSSEEFYQLCHHPVKAGQVTTSINMHAGEVEVSMPRRAVDDRSENTCSNGLHFCSFEYLSHFGGERVVVVKINPADVVSIPVDYSSTKGRCCKYQVISECTDTVDTVFTNSVYIDDSSDDDQENTEFNGDICDNCGEDWCGGECGGQLGADDPEEYTDTEMYTFGYNDGKAKRPQESSDHDFYNVGYRDGRGHKSRQYI